MKSFQQMFFLAGLPRTGSTLLTAILSQNPDIQAEGSSALVELMWQNQKMFSENDNIAGAIRNTNREHTAKDILESLPHNYYKDSRKIVIDKNRNWTHPNNVEMIKDYIDENPKIIVVIRPIIEILESFYFIYKKNNQIGEFEEAMFNFENPLISPFLSLIYGLEANKENFFIITYSDLVKNTKETIVELYNFLEIPLYEHSYCNIQSDFPEGDYGFDGLHEVREQISLRNKEVTLPFHIRERAKEMQKDLDEALEKVGFKDVYL
jgi:sulfotransferase